ncbi:MAG: carboxypeptidase regulatory-like domain-containing protein [Silvibacterium sp.]|nr:carboxypeptidase regulatory-like domain-containing protein [Silvibacterium sp.]
MKIKALSLVAICATALAVLFLSTPATAQFRTSIQGTVTDPTGAVIGGASLTLKDLQTNQTTTRTSDNSGVYNFNALPPDRFDLTVEKDGFEKKVLSDLELIPDQANSVNVVMQPGGSSETVTVNGSTVPAIDTETANTQTSISSNQIQHMPIYQRDATSLIRLAPGVLSDGAQSAGGGGFKAPGTQTGASSGGGGNLGHSSSIFATENGASANTNGSQFQSNGYTVDGISTVSAVWGGSTIITPSQESIGDLKIVSNAYDAENGRFSGAIVDMITKSGTNNLHGSFFFQIVRPGLNAYQRWNGPQSARAFDPTTGMKLTPAQRGLLRDEDRYNQWGGSIGGPIWKDKFFAFFAYEKQAQTVPATSVQWFPTSQFNGLAPAGSIASTFTSFPGANVAGTIIPSTTCTDAGLIEGVNCRTISGQGLNIGSPLTTGLGTQDLTWVSPQNPGIGSGLSNVPDIAQYTISNPTNTNFQQFNGRADANIGSKDHAAFVIYWVPSTKTSLNGGLGYQLFHHDQVNNAFSAIWNHTFSATFLNEARANAAGWRWNELQSNPQAPFGLPQILWFGSPNLGQISLGSIGVPTPSHLNQWTYGYKDVATKIHGSQTWKFGFDFTRLYYLNDPIGAPNYSFYNIWDFLNDAPQGEGGPFQASTGYPGGFRNDNRENIWGIFFQDDWKVRPNLTVSAGLRWSYFGPLSDKNNHMSVLRFGSGSSYLTGITIRQGIDAWNAQKLNFGPQIGFNWLPNYLNGKVVLRGGYGLSYNQEQIANANANDFNPPGTVYGVPGTSTSPTNINPNILYATSSNPHSIYGYPANPHVITTFNSAGLPTAGGANLNALTNDLPTEYIHHYSLEVEMDLSHSWVANIGYMGSSGKHLLFDYDANAYGVIHGYSLNSLVNSVNTFGNNGNSHNNMMVAELKHQFSHDYSVNAQYTWARSFDTTSGPYTRSPYLYNTRFAYGRSDYDVGNTLKLFGIWQPVFFHGTNDWREKIAGGWSLGGVFTFHTGFGWTPVYTAPHQIYCNLCNYGFQQLRPYYNGKALKSTSNDAFKTGSNFPNPGTSNTGTNNDQFMNNYFTVPNYANAIADNPGQIATAFIPPPGLGRNSFPGPRYRDLDMNLAKAFGLPNIKGIGEGARIEVRASFLNIFNTLNIDPTTISNNIQNSNLGQATGALGSRMIDFQARFSF